MSPKVKGLGAFSEFTHHVVAELLIFLFLAFLFMSYALQEKKEPGSVFRLPRCTTAAPGSGRAVGGFIVRLYCHFQVLVSVALGS